jgi:Bacterial Ig-like domain/Bacterial Ig domain
LVFPNETNTGAVGPLKASGSLTLSTPGQVVSGLNISGGVDITASNVTLENCIIHVTAANANWVVSVAAGLTGVTLKNCEIVGPGLSATTQDAGIYIKGDSQVTINACNIHDVGHGIDVSGGPVVIENSYIHDLNAADSSHYDAVYFGGDNNPNFSMLIQNNTFVNTNTQTSAIFMENYFGGVNNVTINDNLLVGGGYTVYLVSNADVIEDGSGGKVSNVSFTNNHLGMGKYGYTYFSGSYNPVYTGNVDDGATLAASLPTGPNTTPPPTQPTPDAPAITSGNHVTNDNTVTVTGTAVAGGTVTVFDGATKLGTTTVGSNGAWTYTTAALADGKHSLTATDTVTGQASAASSAATITVDTHVPAAPVLISDSVVNTNHVLLSGTAEANSTVTVYDGTTAVGTATAGTNGAWSVTTSALATGSQVLTASATDAAGNTSAHSQALDPVIGSSAPLSAPKIVSYSQDSGVAGDGITNDNTLTLTGTAAANSTVKVFDGSTLVGTTTANSSGSWTDILAILSDAKHTLTAIAVNSSGQSSATSSALNVTIDTHAPAAPVLVSDSVVNTNHVLLSGTAEANSTVTVYDGTTAVGTATAGTNGAWSVTTSALATGSQVLTATATDAAGNTSAHSQALDPVIGSSAPPSAPKIVSYSQDTGVVGDHITDDNTLTLSGTAAANSTVAISDGTSKIGTATVNGSGAWSYTTSALSDGNHSLTATDTNSAGHTSSASSALAVTIDTHAPAAPTMAVYTEGGTAISATTTADDFLLKGTAEANSTVNVFDGGKQVGTATTNGSGLWSFDTGHVADGSHSFTSTATDAAGNISAASAAKSVMVDAPVSAVGITNMYESSRDIVTIKGTGDAFSQVKVFDGTKSVGTVTTGADGTWSYTSSSAVSNTVHTFTAQELDSSGHVVATSGNAILGSSGSNTLSGTGANNLFVGNGHPDTFVFASNFGNDAINDFRATGRSHDVVQFSKSVFDSFADVLAHATQSGQNVVIADGTGDSLTLKNVKLAALDKHDFHFA